MFCHTIENISPVINMLFSCHGIITGSALVKVGHTQNKIGQVEKDFVNAAANNFIHPLRKFLDTDMKTIMVSLISQIRVHLEVFSFIISFLLA